MIVTTTRQIRHAFEVAVDGPRFGCIASRWLGRNPPMSFQCWFSMECDSCQTASREIRTLCDSLRTASDAEVG